MSMTYTDRIAWFHEARFGMFIHYGLYTLLGRGEWVQYQERLPRDVYRNLAPTFRPDADCVSYWLDLAVAAGMRYAVLTTKHHDGFCLFETDTTSFKFPAFAGGRDLVAEFVAGCRERDLKVGLYLSNFDWNEPGYFEPDLYPESKERLVRTLHAQTEELLTRYGRIDLLWYDGAWVSLGERKADIPAFWESEALLKCIYKLQPHILVNNRLGIAADLDTPEQHVTASIPGRGWESCMTIGDAEAWGWTRYPCNRKTVSQLLQSLALAASGEGNFLLNIGPRPDGRVDREDEERLRFLGDWMRLHGEAVYGSTRFFPEYTRHWQGAYTRKGRTVYLMLFRYSTEVPVPLIQPHPTQAWLLPDYLPLTIRAGPNCGFVLEGLPDIPPYAYQCVIKMEFPARPQRVSEPDRAAWIENRC